MSNLQPQDLAPSFELQDQNGKLHRLTDYKGKWVLLYFYPKDLTPGCTIEACSFRDQFSEFKKLGVVVLGVSKDSVQRHETFASKYELPFPLLSDSDGVVCEAYGVLGKKKFLGHEFLGIRRWSFLINPQGKIAKVYETVKPKLHPREVLRDWEAMSR